MSPHSCLLYTVNGHFGSQKHGDSLKPTVHMQFSVNLTRNVAFVTYLIRNLLLISIDLAPGYE